MRITTLALVILLSGCVSNTQPGTFKEDFDRQEAAKTRISLGLTYLKNGSYPQAKANLDKAREFAPRSADVHYSLAYYYQRVGENKRADEAYNTAIDLAPRNADIANSYGAFLCQTGQYKEALAYFEKAINNQRYANSAETYENMALCSQTEGEYEDAVGYLQEALNHQPGRPKSLYLLTEMYVQNKQWDKAQQTLTRFEQVGQVTPDYLWLAIKIAEGQGNYSSAKQYGEMLVSVYPTHRYVRDYQQRARKWPQIAVTRKSKSESEDTPPVVVSPTTDTAPPPSGESEPDVASTHASASSESAAEQASAAQKKTAADQQAASAQQAEQQPVADQQPESAPVDTQAVSEPDAAQTAVMAENAAQPGEAEAIEPEAALAASDSAQRPRFHVVKAKENLYRISLKYNIKLSTLQEWNDLGDNGAIFAGMKLWLVPPEEQEK